MELCLEGVKVLERDMGVIWSYENFSQSIARRIYSMFAFWLGSLECRIASLLHCISPHRTGITRHQKHLIDNTSNPNFYVRARANLSQVAQMPLYFAQALPSLPKGIGYRKEEGQEIGTKSIENLQKKEKETERR